MVNAFPKSKIRRQVHTGPAGLNIPEISVDAEDQDFLTALAALTNARKTLSERRKGLREDTERAGMRLDKFEGVPLDLNLGLDSANAFRLSINIHRYFYDEKRYRLTSMKKLLNQLLPIGR